VFCKIELIPQKPMEPENAEELIRTFLCSLARNGQILKDYKLTRGENYVMYVTFPKPDSFDEKYDGIYVTRSRKEINEAFRCEISPLGEDLDSQPYCECPSRTAMEMQTYSHDIDSVFTCCDCGKPVALYELPFPAENEQDFYLIEDWQDNYSSMDRLWMNCICDRYTGNQRVKHTSALNKQGIEISRYMGEKLGCPVYYFLECDYGKSIKAEKVGDQQIHVCPECLKLMKRVRFSPDHERDICVSCHLSYTAH